MMLVQFDSNSVKQLLQTDGERDFDSVGARLEEYGFLAETEGRFDLAEYAHLMSKLIELAEVSEEQELVSDIVQALTENIAFLDPDLDVSQIKERTKASRERWHEYFVCLGEVDDDHWTSNEASNDFEEHSDEVTGPSPQELDLLLTAVKSSAPSDSQVESSKTSSGVEELPNDALKELIEDDDLREAFVDDASRGLDSMEKCSLAIEQNANDNDAVIQFGRELHTLKGASASVGLAKLASEIHEVESTLSTELDSEQTVELMLGVVDKVRLVLQQLNPAVVDSSSPQGECSGERLDTVNFVAGGTDDSLVRIRASKLDRLMDMLAELVVLRNRRECHVSGLAELNDELRLCADRLAYYAQDPGQTEGKDLNSSLTLSELSKDISDLSNGLRHLQSPVSKDNLAISHFIRDFRHELMQLRRIPIAGLFNRIQRSARDAAKAEAKKIRIDVFGEDAGLERELQEKLFEPLLHVVRNAVSHGIESPEKRIHVGKDQTGLISLTAQSNSQMVVLTVEDDGGGLDYEAIRKRGLEKGLIKPNQFLNESELGKLIFHPGFSTRQAASEVSGRGVGMDVVMTTIQQMRGRIDINSRPGKGTSMTIVIPVRSGIEHVMVFRSGGQLFALPMQAVSKVKNHSDESDMSLLTDVLGINRQSEPKDVLLLRSQRNERNTRKLGFLVEEILGPEEVVVRKLPALLQPHPLFCGLTLSGAGETALLLDADRLASLTRNISSSPSETAPESVDQTKPNILVVDDSMSARKLLSKKLISLGMRVSEAADGIEGLEQIRNGQFDLVFTDLDMPRMGGLELLFDLRQGRHKDQRVVVVSSRVADEFCQRSLELGAAAYMTKPVEDNELQEILYHLNLLEK